ncbi:MAG: Manganese-dependent inorganic pyrophosphatase [Candidatus Kaiserbacteria bacterium]|nr:Manganese-dependent inorganic pyrophosphatase [Candidatus Kaiserbacteria bacterium]
MATPRKVFGHLSPDTDTVCCAILWAWYLNTHAKMPALAYRLGELNKETRFVLDRWQVPHPALLESVSAEDEVTIVDTNNPQELFENINDAKIIEIIDHHKLVGGLKSEAPIMMTIRPLASTASVIHDLMAPAATVLPTEMAGLMLSCILSDTLEFRSPTTTPYDKEIATKLALQLGVNMTTYANEMFAAKSDVSEYSGAALITLDSKVFPVGEKNIRVSVLETTTPETVLARKDELVSAIKANLAAEKGTDDVLMFIVDILKEEATVLVYNDLTKQIIKASFNVDVSGETVVLPGIVSRKKQIVPALKI